MRIVSLVNRSRTVLALSSAIVAITVSACDAAHTSRSGVAFASAAGFAEPGRPFALLRFTPEGREQSVAGTSVRRHPSGDLVIAGVFDGGADVGLGSARLDGAATAFVGRYSPSGRPRWVKWMSSADYEGPRVAVDASGGVAVLARTRGTLRPFGAADAAACVDASGCSFASSLFVLSADGEMRWSRRLASRDPRERMTAQRLDVDASGDLTVAGRFGAQSDLFLASYSAQRGERRWFTRIRSSGAANVAGLGVAPGGDAVVTGDATGDLRIDDATTHIGSASGGGAGGFVLRVSRDDGALRWARRVGDATGTAGGLAIAADTTGDVLVVAHESTPAQPGESAIVQKLAGATGEPRWSHAIAKRDGVVRGAAIDVAAGSTPVIAFELTTTAVVVALSSDAGQPIWSRTLSSPDAKAPWTVEATSLASLGPSEVVVTGWFSGRADLGGRRVEGPWGRDHRPCNIDDDDDACQSLWAARAMFVARLSSP